MSIMTFDTGNTIMTKRFTVLSIEDNKADFTFLKKALNKIPDIELNLINIDNGQNALDFLYKKGEYISAPTPNIIILDINLPSINGKEILRDLKKHKLYKTIPIIIFTTSSDQEDIKEMYNLHANSYITKTFNIKELYEKIGIMGKYWFKTNKLPDNNNFCSEQ